MLINNKNWVLKRLKEKSAKRHSWSENRLQKRSPLTKYLKMQIRVRNSVKACNVRLYQLLQIYYCKNNRKLQKHTSSFRKKLILVLVIRIVLNNLKTTFWPLNQFQKLWAVELSMTCSIARQINTVTNMWAKPLLMTWLTKQTTSMVSQQESKLCEQWTRP